MPKKTRWVAKIIPALLVLCLLIPSASLADLTVYFLDVGQGDSAIVVCDNEAMIIDGGLPGQSQKIYSFITKTLGISRLQYVVATHPDNDHIGGLPAVLTKDENDSSRTIKVETLFSPIEEYDSQRFSDLKKKADARKLKIKIPYEGEHHKLGSAKVTFYNSGRNHKSVINKAEDLIKSIFGRDDPEEDPENNKMSLVVKIEYGETTFLFTGDIDSDTENDLLDFGLDFKVDVLKVAHHGSNSSTSLRFLETIEPRYAVISCGTGNRYGHPGDETLSRLSDKNVELYRTDLQGTITCTSDGHQITFTTEHAAKSDVYKTQQK